MKLTLMQNFEGNHPPLCDRSNCVSLAIKFYADSDGHAWALCQRHILELVESGDIDAGEPPRFADWPKDRPPYRHAIKVPHTFRRTRNKVRPYDPRQFKMFPDWKTEN